MTRPAHSICADLRSELAADFGVDLSLVILTVSRLHEMDAEGVPLVHHLREEARRVFWSGVREVLGGQAKSENAGPSASMSAVQKAIVWTDALTIAFGGVKHTVQSEAQHSGAPKYRAQPPDRSTQDR